jgi:hypothetical protein
VAGNGSQNHPLTDDHRALVLDSLAGWQVGRASEAMMDLPA